ncbi:SDR family NAD(P)-dependent oxidoreductase [Aliiglaciecola litoralis]|uniref:SDR family oxidoreductase n=1 Tax=Aliiglaciecola litoralis TaxID=582857 RepID=A0ABN1LEA6_9ALTE
MTNKTDLKVCVVTGGSLGIGAAICESFSQHEYQVINLDIQNVSKGSKNIEYVNCDITDSAAVTNAISNITEKYGRLDVLVSNAGVHFSGTIEQTSDEDFKRVFDINVNAAITVTKAVLPQMKAQGAGVILYIASDQALIAKPNSFAYNLTKAALASMAKTTAIDYASFNIRANAICPGTIETPLYHHAIDNYVARSGADKQQVHAEEAALQPLGRLGQPEEVAALAYFLASEQAGFITGSLQVIDGGYTTQ